MMLKMVDAGLTPEDNLIFLGDVIDRGAHSLEVVDYLIELQARYPSTRVLKGNHEQMMLDARDEATPVRRVGNGTQVTCGTRFSFWWNNGGNRTFFSYAPSGDICDWKRLIHPEHWDFLEASPDDCVIGGYHFVHAGLVPPEQQWLGAQDGMENPKHWIWNQFLNSDADFDGKVVVFGHSIQREGVPLIQANKIGIDTGCGSGGPLTCAILDPATHGTARTTTARFLQA